ncbi:MAG: hypothetical protein ACPGRW_06260 [Flavobacteriaceae bacterium]
MKTLNLKRVFFTVLAIAFVFLINACKSVKSIEKVNSLLVNKIDSLRSTKKVKEVDTVYIERVVKKTIPIKTFIEIPISCDTPQKQFKYSLGVGGNKVSAVRTGSKIRLAFKIDSTSQSEKKIIKSKYVYKIDSLTKILSEFKSKEIKEVQIIKRGWLHTHLKCILSVLGLVLILFVVIRFK